MKYNQRQEKPSLKYILPLRMGIFALVLIVCFFCYSKNFEVNAKQIYIKKEGKMNKEFTQVRASHLLVKTKEEVDKVREEILAGKDFAEAAREVSLCPSGAKGGDLGYFGIWNSSI